MEARNIDSSILKRTQLDNDYGVDCGMNGESTELH